MKRAHISFFTLPAPVHVNPSLSIVASLVRRGHRVTYVTSEKFSKRIGDLGAEVACIPQERWLHCFDLADRMLARAEAYYGGREPDLVVNDHLSIAGHIFAGRLGIPAVTAYITLAFDKRDDFMSEPYAQRQMEWSKSIDRFLQNYGIDKSDVLFSRGELSIFLYTSALQRSRYAFDENCFYAGRCAGEQPYSGVWESQCAGSRPTVLVTASTAYVEDPSYYKMCIEGLIGLGWHIVLAIGDHNVRASFEPLPSHCEIAQGIPQIKIMPHADLLIGLGGMATTMEALYHGIPQIMLSQGHEEAELYARNVAKLGLGIHLEKPETSAASINRAVVNICSGTNVVSRVKRMQQIVRREPGAEEVANRIEEYLAARRS